MWRKPQYYIVILLLAVMSGVGLWNGFAQDNSSDDDLRSVFSSDDDAQNDEEPTDEPTDEPTQNPNPQEETEEPTETEEPVETEEPTEEPTAVPEINLIRVEPDEVIAGAGGILSVFGENFTENTTVRLVGFGILDVELINSGVIRATLPNSLTRGDYGVEVSDPERGSDEIDDALEVNNPPATAAPPEPTREPTNTPQPPTPIPGQPSLLARNFSANPSSTLPGGTVTLTFEVVNQGNRAAQGIAVSVDAGGDFVPANGQASATLPDIGPGGSATVSLTVVAGMDTAPGPTSVPITMTYHDFEGQDLTSTATLSVNVLEMSEASQVTLARYQVDPNPVIPGERVNVTVLVTNTGNETASQVLLRVSGEGVLLAGPQGDSFPLGDIPAGGSAGLELPLVADSEAEPGPRSQPITISFLQSGESQEVSGSMTVTVAAVEEPEALLLLESYDTSIDVLQPGDQFTLTMNLLNVGDGAANNLMVTFGTVTSSGGDDGGSDTTGTDTTGGSSSSTTPSNTFAPLGTGGTVFIGNILENGGTNTLEQDFIVNGSVTSGIYSLPITLRYNAADGAAVQNTLSASVIVLVPPQLQTNLQSPLPESVNVGEPFSLALDLLNTGTKTINVTSATVESENGELLEGAEMFIGPMKTDDDATVNALVVPSEEGTVTVTVTLHYIDDLNHPGALIRTYEIEAVAPPPPPEEEELPPDFGPPVVEEPEEEDMAGRLLLGLLGLGS